MFVASITLSDSDHQDLTDSIIEIPAVEMQLLKWQATLHLYVQMWTNGCTHYLLTPNQTNLKILAEER